MKPTVEDRDHTGEDLVFPASSSLHPPAPDLSMDQYVRFLERARLLGNYRALFEEAVHREPPKKRFVILD